MGGFPILSALTFLPLVGALIIMAVRAATAGSSSSESANEGRTALLAGLVITGATFLVSLAAFFYYDPSTPGYQLVEQHVWYQSISYKLGIDGLSLPLILLTTFLTPICLLASWNSIHTRVTEYVVAFLVLETFMIGVFTALDLVLFYIFFEAGLIPMFLIIGIWGGKEKIYAAFKFFLYTLLGSLLMLVAVVYMYITAGSSDFEVLEKFAFDPHVQTWLWLAFMASFAVKLPMWPVHTWLPDAHVQAPTAGSVILAGVLLKMGGYGFLRFSLPMFPDASHLFQPAMFALAVIAIVYTSLVAWRQTDMKKLIAYSSVAHMGFVTLGVFSFTEVGVQGAIFQMISHGFISGALFLIVGVVYDRMHTREIAAYGGLVHRMPVYATLFMLFTMANVGLPGTSGFIGEILTMVGGFQASTWAAAGAALGVIFSAVYMLTLYRRTVFGQITNPELESIKDMNRIELVTIVPLALLTLLFGVAPNLIFNLTEGAAKSILSMMAGG
ncbi:NADH-quinone oxidoreductase subunit M [uncultured Hyphomonas sp.]|uniref:NADH-quinone oxidoreductase subunit M n=1 Tax=uncultured Hyphomonas sp. TaxID=225298 RepID=UPI002AAB4357|nr:NADH-quinone oxidoreductase subunit M [uncultured Hyphomonas sp.]